MRALAAFLKSQKLILYDRSSPMNAGTEEVAGEFSLAIDAIGNRSKLPHVTTKQIIRTNEA
jgi:hypothetical protein